MSNFPSVRPSLNLQFDSQPTPADMTSHLASVGATFSRASIGTYTDANGIIQESSAGQARPNYSAEGVHEGLLIEESRVNINAASEDFSLSNYILTNATIQINQGIAPDGKASADAWVSPSGSFSPSVRQQYILSSGATYTFSIFAKANGYNFLRINAFFGSSDSSWFNLSTGELGTIGATSTGRIEDYGDGWYRCSITRTQSGGGLEAIYIAGVPSDNTVAYTGDGESGILIWGAQMELGSFPTSYIPTIPTFSSRASTATFFNASGVLSTASTNVARTDHKYIDGEWVEAGLLLEGASTNLLVQSEDLGTTWTGNQITITTNQIDAPDGNTTADKLSPDTDAGAVYQAIAITSSTTYTYSVYMKKGENDFGMLRVQWDGSSYDTINFDLANGTTSRTPSGVDSTSIEDVGNGWYRCIATFTPSSSVTTNFQVRTSSEAQSGSSSTYTGTFNGTNGIYAWGAQLEAQSQPTSYIPTTTASATRSADVYTTATVTRSADVCKITGTAFTDFYNEEEGTIFINAMCEADSSASRFMYSFNNTISSERVVGLIDSSDAIYEIVVDNGVVKAQFTSPTVTLGSFFKNGFRYNTNSFNQVTNGTASTPDTSGSVPTPTQLNIASSRTPNAYFNGYIKKFIYFPRALSDNELIKLTQ